MTLQLHEPRKVFAPLLCPGRRALGNGPHGKLRVGSRDILRGQRFHIPREVVPKELKELVGGRVILLDFRPYLAKIRLEVDPIFQRRKNILGLRDQHDRNPVLQVCDMLIKRIKAAIQEADTAIENLWKALERGQAVDMITERIEKRKQEKNELQGQLAIEMGKQVTFTAPQIKAFLYSLKRGNVNDENNRWGMVNIFLRAIYLYDDRMTLILNGGDRPITIDDILLDEIEEHFEHSVSSHAGCSPLVVAAPP